jgi:predicted CXXCH cytochrome family protein
VILLAIIVSIEIKEYNMNRPFEKLVFAALLFFVGSAGAYAQNISTSPHNLSFGAGGSGVAGETTSLCVYCHTPHNGASGDAPLWNRTAPAGPFDMYNNAFSASIDMVVAGSPQGVSAGCLSCHDGVTAFDAVTNPPPGDPLQPDNTVGTINANADLGTVLTNDHPISVTYNPGLDPDFNTLVSVQGSSIRLFGTLNNQVECGSCHNPHDNVTAPPFLRIPNTGSAICMTCHDK